MMAKGARMRNKTIHETFEDSIGRMPSTCKHCGSSTFVPIHKSYNDRYVFSNCIICGRSSDHKCDEKCESFKGGLISVYNVDTIPEDRRRKNQF